MEKRYAVIKEGNNIVDNIILADENYKIEGFNLHELDANTFCEPEMFLNFTDGIYYQDNAFTLIRPSIQVESS